MDTPVSNLYPAEDGNTRSSSATSNKGPTGAKSNWFLTLKYDVSTTNLPALKTWIREHTTRCVMQGERGEGGFEHIQIQLRLKKKQRFSWFKHHLDPTVHCETTRNEDAAYDYCSKNESRIWGPWVYPEPPGAKPKDPMEGLTLFDWQEDLIRTITGPVDPRTIVWYYDPEGGKGKTWMAKHILLNYEACFFQGGKKSDIAYSWNGEPVCIFNFARQLEGHVSYDAIESLKDGLIYSAKYESKAKLYNQPHVIVFANWLPDQTALSEDRWDLRYL